MKTSFYDLFSDKPKPTPKVANLDNKQLFDLANTIINKLSKRAKATQGHITVSDGNFYFGPFTIQTPVYVRTKIPQWISRRKHQLTEGDGYITVHDDGAYYEFIKMFYQFIKLPDGSPYPLNQLITK